MSTLIELADALLTARRRAYEVYVTGGSVDAAIDD